MFSEISPEMAARMRALEAIDARDRTDGTTHGQRLRQISPETGKFVALLAALSPTKSMVEIGTSAGYSGLWLALACRAAGAKLLTFEIDPDKAELARATFKAAGVEDVVELRRADALVELAALTDIGFCFLDAEKDIYQACYDLIVPRLAPGGVLVADNAQSHVAALRPMLERALADTRLDALIAPIGTGLLVCRKK